jgi:proton-coupled amino acid transporter
LGTKTGTSALSRQEWLPQDEDPEIIRKHLVSGFEKGSRASTPPVASVVDAESSRTGGTTADVPLSEEFTSLQLQGGDITRQIYRFADKSTRRGSSVHQRSHSFSHPVREGEGETVNDIIVPGGFRRNFIQRAYTKPVAGDELRPTFVTRNFLHFLTLYGHFAGEDLEEWDEAVTGSILVHIG